MSEPRHPQLMDPAYDPEEFIASSIYWYPRLFPTRTEVLDHTFLCNCNGYDWSEDGKIRSVFSHFEPGEDFPEKYERRAREEEARNSSISAETAAWEREEAAELMTVRSEYLRRARVYNPIRATEQDYPDATRQRARMITSRDLPWTLLGRAPAYVDPRWKAVLEEVVRLFSPLLFEQGSLW
jgi:hypothetical protein